MKLHIRIAVLIVLVSSFMVVTPTAATPELNTQATDANRIRTSQALIAPDCPQPDGFRGNIAIDDAEAESPGSVVDVVASEDNSGEKGISPQPDASVAVYVSVTVSSNTWTTGQTLSIGFYIYNDEGYTVSLRLKFYAYDPNLEWSVETTTSVARFREKTVYLYKTIPSTPIGLKRGVAEAKTTAGETLLYKDYGYAFVQRFGPPSTSPSYDDTAAMTGSSTYYWEGFSNDGFNIPDSYALWRSTHTWEFLLLAAQWIDGYGYSGRRDIAVALTHQVYSHMDYVYQNEDPALYSQAAGSAWSDNYIKNIGYKGVCDEFAIMYISLARALGIPARIILGVGHAWAEVWADSGGVWGWHHADPTWNCFDDPGIYELFGLYMTGFWVCVDFDDRRVDCTGDADGSQTNEMLSWNGDRTGVWYDGPNDYGDTTWHDDCSSLDWWFDSPSQPATWWPNPIWGIAGGTLANHPLGFLHTSSNDGWATGPFWYKDLFDSRPLDQFKEFRIKVSYDNPQAIYKGCLAVALYDPQKNLICYIALSEWTDASVDMDFYAVWRMSDGTSKQWQYYNLDWEYFNNEIWIYRDAYNNIWVYFGGVESGGQIMSASDFQLEMSRRIQYIGIQWRKGSGTYLDANLWDIWFELDV